MGSYTPSLLFIAAKTHRLCNNFMFQTVQSWFTFKGGTEVSCHNSVCSSHARIALMVQFCLVVLSPLSVPHIIPRSQLRVLVVEPTMASSYVDTVGNSIFRLSLEDLVDYERKRTCGITRQEILAKVYCPLTPPLPTRSLPKVPNNCVL